MCKYTNELMYQYTNETLRNRISINNHEIRSVTLQKFLAGITHHAGDSDPPTVQLNIPKNTSF